MGEVTGIAWTDHTFNPWIGCAKISAGCANCYAAVDTFARSRRAQGLELWGENAARHITSTPYWRGPLKWDRAAREAGVRRRVFCGSLCDVFEDRPDLDNPRILLFELIQSTPNLDWLLLTKRPVATKAWLIGSRLQGLWPMPNVWLGTSVENQCAADERIPVLLSIPAKVRFLSMEPLLDRVDLQNVQWQLPDSIGIVQGGVLGDRSGERFSPRGAKGRGIGWVIVGGESGPKARPFDLAWVRSIVGQCKASGVACFVKQLGAHPVARNDDVADWFSECGHLSLETTERFQGAVGRVFGLRDKAGADPAEWPEDLRVREFPTDCRAIEGGKK